MRRRARFSRPPGAPLPDLRRHFLTQLLKRRQNDRIEQRCADYKVRFQRARGELHQRNPRTQRINSAASLRLTAFNTSASAPISSKAQFPPRPRPPYARRSPPPSGRNAAFHPRYFLAQDQFIGTHPQLCRQIRLYLLEAGLLTSIPASAPIRHRAGRGSRYAATVTAR